MIARYATTVLGLVVFTAAALRFTVFTPYLIRGSAMEPTLLPGEYVLATRASSVARERDAVAVVECPRPEPHLCIARVIAIEGDRLDFDDGVIHVNGRARDELIVPGGRDPLVIPPASIFVVNDNPADGEDSRVWGPLEADKVYGRVRLIWLSLDWFDRDGEVRNFPVVRWSRTFGAVL